MQEQIKMHSKNSPAKAMQKPCKTNKYGNMQNKRQCATSQYQKQ